MKNHARFHKCFMFDEGDGKGSPRENWIMLTITPAQYAPQPECRLSASQLKCLSIRIVWKVKNHAEKKNDFAWQRNWVVCMTYAGTQRKLKRCWMRKKFSDFLGLCCARVRVVRVKLDGNWWHKVTQNSQFHSVSLPFPHPPDIVPESVTNRVNDKN